MKDKSFTNLFKYNQKLFNENYDLRLALNFYADPDNWDQNQINAVDVDLIGGNLAREVLGKLEENNE